MTNAKKFLFDTHDFDQVRSKPGKKAYTEEHLLLTKEQSFILGKTEGMKIARQQQEERLADLLQKTLAVAEKLASAEERREVEKCIDATKLAVQVIRKLLPKFALQYAIHEIEHVAAQTIENKKNEPRITVTVPAEHLSALKIRLDALAAEKLYSGKIVLLADAGLPATDCRVEWADGGAERIYERLFSQIEDKFDKAISAMKAGLA